MQIVIIIIGLVVTTLIMYYIWTKGNDGDDSCNDEDKRIDLDTGKWKCAAGFASIRAISSRLAFARCKPFRGECSYSEAGLNPKDVERIQNIPCGSFGVSGHWFDTHKDQMSPQGDAILLDESANEMPDYENIGSQCMDADKKLNLDAPGCKLYKPRLLNGKLVGYFRPDGKSLLVEIVDQVWAGCEDNTEITEFSNHATFRQTLCYITKTLRMRFLDGGEIHIGLPNDRSENPTDDTCYDWFKLTNKNTNYLYYMLYLSIYFKFYANNEKGIEKAKFYEVIGGVDLNENSPTYGQHSPMTFYNVPTTTRPVYVGQEGNCSAHQKESFNLTGNNSCNWNKNPWDTTSCCEKNTCPFLDEDNCKKDSNCVAISSCYSYPQCDSYDTKDACDADDVCVSRGEYYCANPPGVYSIGQYGAQVCAKIYDKDSCNVKDGCEWTTAVTDGSGDGGVLHGVCGAVQYPYRSDNKEDCIFGGTYELKYCSTSEESKKVCVNNNPTECRAKEDCYVQCEVKGCENLSAQECKDASSRCTFEEGSGECFVTNWDQTEQLCYQSEVDGTCASDCQEVCAERADYFVAVDPDDNDCKYGAWSTCESPKPQALCDKEDCGTGRCEPSYRQYTSDPERYNYSDSLYCLFRQANGGRGGETINSGGGGERDSEPVDTDPDAKK